jgi:alkylated DNA repair dioxygenase AlkB
MPDLFAEENPRRLSLPDADLTLFTDVDLGAVDCPEHAPGPGTDYDHWLEWLLATVPWRAEEINLWGKRYLQPRLLAWYGDPGCNYRYSGLAMEPLVWTPPLLGLKRAVEALSGASFNSVLLNYYRDQSDSMGMHSDDERELGCQPLIASLSLGETRSIMFRHKTRRDLGTFRLPLPAGSVLVMRGTTQSFWKHGIARERQPCGPRINLTFRRILSATPGK